MLFVWPLARTDGGPTETEEFSLYYLNVLKFPLPQRAEVVRAASVIYFHARKRERNRGEGGREGERGERGRGRERDRGRERESCLPNGPLATLLCSASAAASTCRSEETPFTPPSQRGSRGERKQPRSPRRPAPPPLPPPPLHAPPAPPPYTPRLLTSAILKEAPCYHLQSGSQNQSHREGRPIAADLGRSRPTSATDPGYRSRLISRHSRRRTARTSARLAGRVPSERASQRSAGGGSGRTCSQPSSVTSPRSLGGTRKRTRLPAANAVNGASSRTEQRQGGSEHALVAAEGLFRRSDCTAAQPAPARDTAEMQPRYSRDTAETAHRVWHPSTAARTCPDRSPSKRGRRAAICSQLQL